MTTYRCIYYRRKNNKLERNRNSACWRGLLLKACKWCIDCEAEELIYASSNSFSKIYIDIEVTTLQFKTIKQLIYILNFITPCELKKFKGKTYFVYTMAYNHNYNKNLILLNYVRLLWYIPEGFNYMGFFTHIHNFNKDIDDPLYFLMDSIRINILPLLVKYSMYGDHCNVVKNIIPKTSKYLLEDTEINSKGTRAFYIKLLN